jgi:uracil phosphoribosyltransferase
VPHPPVTLGGPLAGHHLARLRDRATASPDFRRSAHALATLVIAETMRDLPTRPGTVTTPLAPAAVELPARRVTVVPVLRAGLGMLQAALDLLPEDTRVGFLGLARDELTARASSYLESLPADLGDDEVIVLDVMIATGGSAVDALAALRAAGAGRLRLAGLLAAPEGIAAIRAVEPELPITVAAIDARLDERRFIVPGLGDAGDRLFAEPR